ncbi:MAG: hypothetical protein WA919_26355 [Coleofasciculaceae cyanobacterium]
MISDQLPLLDIFNSLRQRHGLPLGVDEYLVVVRSLQVGFGMGSRQELEQLCCMVWAKSEDESRLIQRLFEEMWKPVTPSSTQKKSEISSPEESTPELEESASVSLEVDEPVQVVQAVRRNQRSVETLHATSLQRPRHILLTEYFPVTKRQMKQSWRYLRRPVREGTPVELDIEATVDKLGRDSILLEPVLVPRRVNRTDLVLIVDQEGSMVPFHALSRQLIETAERGGKLRQTRVFYFHDYADEYLYRHPALLNAQLVDEILAEVGERAVVLIVSDGGAARGNFDRERVKYTQEWIERLQQSVQYVAWLNPMPNDSWQHTTAGEIREFVPMFEMSRQGMNAAISVLRGRYFLGMDK